MRDVTKVNYPLEIFQKSSVIPGFWGKTGLVGFNPAPKPI